MSRTVSRTTLATLLLGCAAPAAAAVNVTFIGAVANLCVLTLSVPGALGTSSDGKMLSSSETGGTRAVVGVSAAGSSPSVAFTAPQLTGPTESVGGATSTLAFSSLGGVTVAPTNAAANVQLNRLVDAISVEGRVSNPAGFVTGTYTLSSTATCQQ